MLSPTILRNTGAALALMLLLSACEERPAPNVDAPNVILVTLDTLRADHLSIYGYPRETAPFLTRMANEGTAFANAIAACSHTAPAHASIFTSMSPMRHRVVENGQALRPEFASMASIFQAAGYDTFAFTSVEFLHGLRPGFAEFYPGDFDDNANTVISRVIDRLEERDPHRPFFVWIHLYDPHQPYESGKTPFLEELFAASDEDKEAFTEYLFESHGLSMESVQGRRDGMRLLIDKYDNEIRVADGELERLYDYMQGNALNDDARWIFLADHGEGLQSHGLLGHDKHIYQEQLAIPLIFHRAGEGDAKGQVDEGLARQVDVLPTVLEWIGLEAPEQVVNTWEGRSLTPILAGDELTTPVDYAFSQRRAAPPNPSWVQEEVYALQTGQHKYIWHEKSADELYELNADPLELDNRLGQDPELDGRLREAVENLTSGWMSAGLLESVVDGDGHRAELEALGYLDGDG